VSDICGNVCEVKRGPTHSFILLVVERFVRVHEMYLLVMRCTTMLGTDSRSVCPVATAKTVTVESLLSSIFLTSTYQVGNFFVRVCVSEQGRRNEESQRESEVD